MGVDLTILPQDFVTTDGKIHASSILRFDRDRELFEAIGNSGIESDVSAPVTCHLSEGDNGETCYGDVVESPYGENLTWCTAGQLASVMAAIEMSKPNEWIHAAIKAMPIKRPIILYYS